VRRGKSGRRLDYVLVPHCLAPRVHDAFILRDVPGSDHVPYGIVLLKK
jgi:exonuclease III